MVKQIAAAFSNSQLSFVFFTLWKEALDLELLLCGNSKKKDCYHVAQLSDFMIKKTKKQDNLIS